MANMPAVAEGNERDDRAALAGALSAAETAGLTQNVARWSITRPPGIALFRAHTPASFGDDVRSRRPTVVETYRTHQNAAGVETGIGNIGMYGVSPITRAARPVVP